MSTFRKIASDITNDLKANNLDDHISYRFIISKLISSAEVFFKQDAESRKLFDINTLWKDLYCIELEDVDIINCHFDIGGCKQIKKSTQKLPQTYQTSYGNVIKIMSLNYSKTYKQIRPEQYSFYTKRKFQLPQTGYFWIIDDYLYIPNSDVEAVRSIGIFKNTNNVNIFNGVDGAECVSFLDAEFNFPDYIITIAKKDILESLANVTKRTIVDNNPNLNTNQK